MKVPYINDTRLDICRADFDMDEFRRKILQYGMLMRWEYAVPCPCFRTQDRGEVVTHSTEARGDCPSCRGTGQFYAEAQETRALLTTTSTTAKLATMMGEFQEGDAMLTMLPEHVPTRLDRLTLISGTVLLCETVTKTDQAVERTRYPVVRRRFPTGNADGTPGVAEVTELGVMYCRATNTAGVLQGDELREGDDFVVTDEGFIDWTLSGDDAPPPGAKYTIRYYARPAFLVQGLPYVRRDMFRQDIGVDNAELDLAPVLVHVRMEFLGPEGGSDPDATNPNPDQYPVY